MEDIRSPSCFEAEQATKQPKLEKVSDDIMVKPLKKATGFADLPPELHLMIWEIAMDLPPSIVSVGVNLQINHGQPIPDRETHISQPETNKFNRWHWAQKMAAEFLYAKRATEKMFGTAQECRANPLTSVRPNKDIVLYVFKGTYYKNYSWYWGMDKQHTHRYMSPGIEHVGILWDRFKNNGLWCTNEVHHWGGNVKLCPGELAHFIDHCPSVKHVYIHALIRLSDTTCRKKSAMIAKMNHLIATQKTRPDLVRFEDTDRIWVEVDKSLARTVLSHSMLSIFTAMDKTKAKIGHMWSERPLDERKAIKFHLLVASYFKDVAERP